MNLSEMERLATPLFASGRLDDLSGLNDLLNTVEIDNARAEHLNHIEDLLNKSRKFKSIRAYSRNKHYMSVRSAATAATARLAAGILWNPAAAARIQLWEWWCFITTAGAANPGLTRATARGTASTTSTSAVGNSVANDAASPAGVVIDTAWSVAPTISAVNMGQLNIAATAGNGVIIPIPDPIDIGPGAGAAIITTQSVIFPVSDLTFVFGD